MDITNTINIEQIMEEIRNDIKAKGYTNDMLSFQDVEEPMQEACSYSKEAYKEIVGDINRNSYVPWYRELGQGGIRGIIKRYIRKMVTFLVAPMADEQNLFNEEVAQAFSQLTGYIEKQEELVEIYKENILELEKKIEKLGQELKVSGEN